MCLARIGSVIPVEGHMMGNQKPQRAARGDRNGEHELLAVAARFRPDLNHSRLVAIHPQTGLRSHLECRRDVEQPPRAADLDEHSLPMGAKQAEVAMHSGQQTIDVDVSLRQHRVEDSAHPDRRCQRRLVWCRVQSTAKYVAVWAKYTQFLRSQHDVTIGAVKERQEVATVIDLLMPPLRSEHRSQLVDTQVSSGEQRSGAEERRICRRLFVRSRIGAQRDRRGFRQLEQRPHPVEVRMRRCARVIRDIRAEEAGRGGAVWLQLQARAADGDQRVFMLQAPAWQVGKHSGRCVARATIESVKLQGVGRERRALPQGADQAPRMPAVSSQILPRRNRDSARWMR